MHDVVEIFNFLLNQQNLFKESKCIDNSLVSAFCSYKRKQKNFKNSQRFFELYLHEAFDGTIP